MRLLSSYGDMRKEKAFFIRIVDDMVARHEESQGDKYRKNVSATRKRGMLGLYRRVRDSTNRERRECKGACLKGKRSKAILL